MREREPARLPLLCRVVIGAAGWIVPRPERAPWLRKWRDEAGHWWAFLNERDEFLIRDGYPHLLRHCATAIVDAFWLRFERARLREFLRGPAFVLLAAVAVWWRLASRAADFRCCVRFAPRFPTPIRNGW